MTPGVSLWPLQVASALGPMDRVVGIAHMLPPPLPSPADVAANGAASDAGAGGGGDGEGGEEEEEMGEGGAENDVASRHAEAVREVLVNTMPGQAFGDPILVRVAEGETMADLKAKVQVSGGVSRWGSAVRAARPLPSVRGCKVGRSGEGLGVACTPAVVQRESSARKL